MADSGPGRRPEVSDEEILDIFREADDPVLTTSEVESELDIKHRGTFDRLSKLADEGTLKKKKAGEKGMIWWHEPSLRDRYG